MSEAERLAQAYDGRLLDYAGTTDRWCEEAAAELRRLQAEVEALRKVLKETRKIIVEVCGACSVPLPESTLERVDAAMK